MPRPIFPNNQHAPHPKMQDAAFIRKMVAEIRAGTEHPPVGISTTPSTSNPRYIPHRQATPTPSMSSSLGSLSTSENK